MLIKKTLHKNQTNNSSFILNDHVANSLSIPIGRYCSLLEAIEKSFDEKIRLISYDKVHRILKEKMYTYSYTIYKCSIFTNALEFDFKQKINQQKVLCIYFNFEISNFTVLQYMYNVYTVYVYSCLHKHASLVESIKLGT